MTIETGDVEAGLKAAAAIGDDRLQRMQTGRVAPDRFTHGSSEQRVDLVPAGPRSRRSESLRYVQVTLPASSCPLPAGSWQLEAGRPLLPSSHGALPAVGRSIPRREGRAKVTGRARYVDDMSLPGMLVRRDGPQPGRRAAASSASTSTLPFPGTSSPSSRQPTFPAQNRVALIVDDQPVPRGGRHQSPRGSRSSCSRIAIGRCSRRRAGTCTCEVDPLPGVFSIEEALARRTRDLGRATTSSRSYTVSRGDVDAAFAGRGPDRRGRSTRPARRSSSTSSRTG